MPDPGRVLVPELLDDTPPDQARDSLRDLTRINRYLGGYWTLGRMLAKLVEPGEAFSLLDVGAASGDMGGVVRRRYPKARVVSLDRLASHLEEGQGEKVVGDAFALPFAHGSFDFVFSSLFLHHFPDDAVVELLRESGVVARRAVLAVDLERGPLAHHFIPATRWIFGWDPITLHDAPASVDAAFKKDELAALAERAGLRQVSVRVHRPWSRLALVGRTSSR
jgi:hypothetical protein